MDTLRSNTDVKPLCFETATAATLRVQHTSSQPSINPHSVFPQPLQTSSLAVVSGLLAHVDPGGGDCPDQPAPNGTNQGPQANSKTPENSLPIHCQTAKLFWGAKSTKVLATIARRACNITKNINHHAIYRMAAK
ncbi:hypothetical protein V2G26_009704 [Clonostachys chloroleuca]